MNKETNWCCCIEPDTDSKGFCKECGGMNVINADPNPFVASVSPSYMTIDLEGCSQDLLMKVRRMAMGMALNGCTIVFKHASDSGAEPVQETYTPEIMKLAAEVSNNL